MYPNTLKERLKKGEIILGTGMPAPSPHAVGTILDSEPDFLWIDTEHNPFGAEALDYIPVLCRMRGCAPMIRVAWNDPALIKKAYDVGAVAVMVIVSRSAIATPSRAFASTSPMVTRPVAGTR